MAPLVGEGRNALIAMFALLAVAIVPLALFNATPAVVAAVGLTIFLSCGAYGTHKILESGHRKEAGRS